MTLRVRQKNVPANFRMSVPIEITFEQEDIPAFRELILVDGLFTEKTFSVSAEPDELIFNAGNTVLSEWDESDFEEITE